MMMKRMFQITAAFAFVACVACTHPDPAKDGPLLDGDGLSDPELVELEAARPRAHPLASCGFCGVAGGRNDVKHLCPASVAAWDIMVACICVDSCAAVCGPDWCARLDDVAYSDASPACMSCLLTSCSGELTGCATAQ